MKIDNKSNYYIKRVRLINFHNFVNETIEIADRGHLFVLGDNASGKTTLIDAVQYVLTAGESMEFNSAARVTGNKAGGRRAQGIITRYNIDIGHLNPSGAITYAALEIIGHNGNPWTVAIGMSVNSPDENLKRWGVIRSGNLECVPFIVENDNDEFRPRTAYEMKKALNGTGFFGQLQRYKNVLAQQFLGGEKQFKDFCMFLSIGKAYRELASQTSDYHELFKKLLPEPQRDLFEKIIDSLKSLDSSKSEIQSLKDKYDYIKNLSILVDQIKYKQKHAFAGECIALQFEGNDLENTLAVLKHKKDRLEEKHVELEGKFVVCEKEKKHIENRLDDYRQKDSSGLTREEKTLTERLRQISIEKGSAEVILLKLKDEISVLQNNNNGNIDKIEKLYKEFLYKFSNMSLLMPFSIAELITPFEKFIHMEIEDTVSETEELNFTEYYGKAGLYRDSYVSEIAKLENIHKEHIETVKGTEEQISILEKQLEFLPNVEYFADVTQELKDRMISFKPIYKDLFWNKGVVQPEMDAVEEFIGSNLLCSIILPEDDFIEVEEMIFCDYPGIRLISEKKLDSLKNEIPAWIKQYFDLSKSDPDSIKALAAELYSEEEPEIKIEEELLSVKFRAHKRGLFGLESYIIGEENRQLKIKRDIKSLKLELKDLKKAEEEINKEIKQKINIKNNLADFLNILNKDTRILDRHIALFNQFTSALNNKKAVVEDKQSLLDNMNKEFGQLNERLIKIKEIIRKEGLADLENKINDLTQKLYKYEKELRNIDKKIGANEILKAETLNDFKDKNSQLAENKIKYRQRVDSFINKYDFTGEIEGYLSELRSTFKLHNAIDSRNMTNSSRLDETASKAVLSDRIRDKQFSIEFGFTYDEEINQLTDRANRNIQNICRKYDIDIKDQQEIINDRTTELFKKIIMNDLVFYLREKIEHLQAMVKKINSLLGNRYFGNNQYIFKIKVHKKYERFISVIKKFNPWNEEIENELQNFFNNYRNEIVETEPSEIPEILDYRNWYVYEMYVKSPDSEGNVMNKRIKSIGSGGEQAVPNYLLILTISHFLYSGTKIKLPILIFDEAFYGIDAGRRDQLMGFAGDIGLQIFIATPDQDGVRKEIAHSTSLLVVKDKDYDVHLYPFHWKNPDSDKQGKLKLFQEDTEAQKIQFEEEL